MEIDGIKTIQRIHAVLTTAAGERHPITYSEAMDAIGWDYVHTYQRNVFAYMLKAIANMELGAGHPPLTAIIVSKDHGIPTQSFFKFVRLEGRMRKDETDEEYWAREIQRVYDRWTTIGEIAP